MAFPHKENGPVVLRFSEWAAEAVPALILTSFGHGFSWSPQRITSQNQQEASSYGYSAKQAVKHQVGPLRRNLTDRKFMTLRILKAFTRWIFEISERIFRKHSECSWWFMGLRWQLWQVNQTCRHFYDDYKTSNSWNSCSWWLQTDRQVSSSAPVMNNMLPGVRREKETVFLGRYILREITLWKWNDKPGVICFFFKYIMLDSTMCGHCGKSISDQWELSHYPINACSQSILKMI